MDKSLVDILKIDFPEEKKIDEGFLHIVNSAFKENAISNSYSFFLDQKKNKQIADLLVTCLIELIAEKANKILNFSSFVCDRECYTPTGKRIDLVIDAPDEKSSILIENKVFHHLNNDLKDYWTYNDYPSENKIGVVLSLSKIILADDLKDQFICITHGEWMARVRKRGLPASIKPKEFIYLTDFISHMENISQSTEMNEQTRFYFENTSRVKKAIETENSAYNFIVQQLEKVASNLGWRLYGSSHDWRHIWDEANKAEIYYAVEIYDLFSVTPRVNIIIEMYKEALTMKEAFLLALRDNADYKNLEKENRGGGHWLHFVNKWYSVDIAQIANFSDFLTQKITNDFKPVMDILQAEFHKRKSS